MTFLITAVPTFDAMAATARKNGTTTTAFTDAEKKLKDLENALKAKLAEIKKAEEDKEAKTPDNTIDTSQTIDKKEDCEKITELRSGTECYKDDKTGKWKIRWTFKVGDDCPVKDCSVDKAVTKCVYEKVTESSFSCKITECIDTHEVIGGVCKKKEPDTTPPEAETEAEPATQSDVAKPTSKPEPEEKCCKDISHAKECVQHTSYCEITECDPGWYPHEMRECKQEPTEMECRGRIKNSTEVKVQYNSFGIPDCYVHKCGRGYKPSSDYKACERDEKYANMPKEYCEKTLKGEYTEDSFCKCGTVYFEFNQMNKTCKLEEGSDDEYTIQ
jgi:hypothetical protein